MQQIDYPVALDKYFRSDIQNQIVKGERMEAHSFIGVNQHTKFVLLFAPCMADPKMKKECFRVDCVCWSVAAVKLRDVTLSSFNIHKQVFVGTVCNIY